MIQCKKGLFIVKKLGIQLIIAMIMIPRSSKMILIQAAILVLWYFVSGVFGFMVLYVWSV